MKKLLVCLTALFAPAIACADPGINLNGCYSAAILCPSNADIDFYADSGFKLVRLGFRDTTPLANLYASADRVLKDGMTVILDRHQFKWPSVAAQIDFWTNAIGKYRGNRRVVIGLMNEPRGFNDRVVTNDYMQWARDTRAIIAGLRARGVTNTVAVEWPGSSAAFRFDKSESPQSPCVSAACALDRSGGLGDKNVVFETHMYFDYGSMGISGVCQPYLVLDRTRAAAARRGYHLLLGESAFGSWRGVPASCRAVGQRAIDEIEAHPETWMGVTWWGGGREWASSYVFAAAPVGHSRSTYLDALTMHH